MMNEKIPYSPESKIKIQSSYKRLAIIKAFDFLISKKTQTTIH